MVGPIPFTAIDRYAARFGHDDPEDFRVLLAMVRVMDDVFREFCAKKQPKGDT